MCEAWDALSSSTCMQGGREKKGACGISGRDADVGDAGDDVGDAADVAGGAEDVSGGVAGGAWGAGSVVKGKGKGKCKSGKEGSGFVGGMLFLLGSLGMLGVLMFLFGGLGVKEC